MSNQVLNSLLEFLEEKKDNKSFTENEYLIGCNILKESHELYLKKTDNDLVLIDNIDFKLKGIIDGESYIIIYIKEVRVYRKTENKVFFSTGDGSGLKHLGLSKFQQFLKCILRISVSKYKKITFHIDDIQIDSFCLYDFLKGFESLNELSFEQIEEFWDEQFCDDTKSRKLEFFANYIFKLIFNTFT